MAKAKMKQSGSQKDTAASDHEMRAEDFGILPEQLTRRFDRAARARVASLTGGMSPVAVAGAMLDWSMHLAMSPGRQLELLRSGVRKATRLSQYATRVLTDPDCEPATEPQAHDRRFNDPSWKKMPFNLLSQGFLLTREWWQEATHDVEGVTAQHEALVSFLAHEILDAVSPYNLPLTNPQVLGTTASEKGANLARGVRNLVEDTRRNLSGELPVGTEDFVLGENIACTPGKVIFRNRLIELIQYAPAKDKVVAEPLLVVPPWIMKYYILDLSPKNSMVKYLVEQGHTVFMISWKNPDGDDSNLGLNDYLRIGVMEALDVVSEVVPGRKINSVGYCAGGTLLTMAAATMARDGDERLHSVTTFTAQTDCTEPGEIQVFLNDAQLTIIKEMMRKEGYLDAKYFAKAFGALNSNDLVWMPQVERYLLGKDKHLIDLMAWNADATRVPFRLHYEWLKNIFLDNQLAEDHYQVGGKNIYLSDIRVPTCFVATETDHVAPWRSVYKFHRLAPNSDLTFILTNGGHNAGIACGANHPRRRHRMHTRASGDAYVSPGAWLAQVPAKQGSWWPSWNTWLKKKSGRRVLPPEMGGKDQLYRPIGDAPGSYVRML